MKPKEYPKTTLPTTVLKFERYVDGMKIEVDSTPTANAAIQEFITSGEMMKYFLNPENGFVTKDNV